MLCMIGKILFAILMAIGVIACVGARLANQAIFFLILFCITVWLSMRESKRNKEFKEFQRERRSR